MLLPSLAALSALASAYAQVSLVDVAINKTSFVGVYNSTLGVDTFRGISYGTAERFKRTTAPSYDGDNATVVNATAPGVACPQVTVSSSSLTTTNYGEYGFGEDCTLLDIYRPHNTTSSSKLPVMLWIYGGGLTQGASFMYPGSGIVAVSSKMDLPVITVIINYRLALWGFLGGKEAEDNGALNLGLYDQRDAMTWVQNYISYFGGDKDKVTVFGQSSGSMSIAYHFLTEDTNLFRAAILESGVSTSVPVLNASASQSVYDALVNLAGCNNSSDTFSCIQTADESVLANAANSIASNPNSYSARPWAAAIDGEIIPDSPAVLTAQGKIANKPFIVGDVQDEGTVFVQPQALNTTDDYVTWLGLDYVGRNASFLTNETTLATIERLYPDVEALGSPYGTGNVSFFGEQFKRGASTYGDIHFHAPRRNWLEVAQSKGMTAWCYEFAQTLPSVPEWTGVFHASDVFFVFLELPSTSPDFALAEQTVAYWVSFATHLDPNLAALLVGAPLWTQYGALKTSMYMSSNETKLIVDNFRKQQTDFIQSVADQFLVSPTPTESVSDNASSSSSIATATASSTSCPKGIICMSGHRGSS
ncbi:Alpha/Beta hydrolase protein [Lentinula aff. detonsa]|uniref:Carboxylic ester hydrolase n=1 Tax=Lentinula aff. detonsa TaxID=2804958 RepID=A0AA38NRJ2_9AGAR|nr:Alpha/Beta hydrolase protein [Lentinula aff. detonsa]